MLIEFPKGEVCIDKNPTIADFRINFLPFHQIRCKFTIIEKDKNIPMDIFVERWQILPLQISFGGLGQVGIIVVGRELNHNNQINLKLQYSFLKKKYFLNGTMNGRPVNIETTTPRTILNIFDDIFLR